jgi:chemotaxis signal transduction protein
MRSSHEKQSLSSASNRLGSQITMSNLSVSTPTSGSSTPTREQQRTQPAARVRQATVALLVAPFGDILVALPMNQVQKVLKSPQIFRSQPGDRNFLGILHFEDREAITIDLHQRVYGGPNPKPENFVAILQAASGSYYGIAFAALPAMVTAAADQLRSLPPEFRDRDALGIASHVAQVTLNGQAQTIFLLDLQQILL